MSQKIKSPTKTTLLGTMALGVALGIGTSACGKKKNDSAENDGSTVQVAGQLNIPSFQTAGLAMTLVGDVAMKGWPLINGVYTKQYKAAQEIEVASDGSFAWDAASSAGSFSNSGSGDGGGSASTFNISGIVTTYIKTGNIEAEATSMKFVGMPSGTETLSGIPTDSIESNSLSVGTVLATSGSDDARGDVDATGSKFTGISDAGVAAIARTDDALKMVKNAHMNENWTAKPFYLFTHAAGYADARNQYSAAVTAYTGAGFYVSSEAAEFSWNDICPSGSTGSASTTVSFTPPSSVTTSSGSKTIFDNSGTLTRSTQGDATICTGDMFYARDDSKYSAGGIMLNFASGGGITSAIPSGIWRLKSGSTEIGRFDLAISKPLDSSNNLKVFTVKVNYTDSSSAISKIDVKFYRYDSATSTYIQVTDVAPLKKLLSELTWEGQTSSGGNERATLAIDETTAIASATLSTPFSYAGTTLQSSSISYMIGSSTYRFEFR